MARKISVGESLVSGTSSPINKMSTIKDGRYNVLINILIYICIESLYFLENLFLLVVDLFNNSLEYKYRSAV